MVQSSLVQEIGCVSVAWIFIGTHDLIEAIRSIRLSYTFFLYLVKRDSTLSSLFFVEILIQ